MSTSLTPADATLTRTLVSLMKGVVYRDEDPESWKGLLQFGPRVREHVALLGLELVLDETEAYAFLRQRVPGPDETELPRLVARRPLSYGLSLLLVLLRKKLAEHDAQSGDPRLIITMEQVADMIRIFVADTSNEAKLIDRIRGDIEKAVKLGFLRPLKGKTDSWEVRRILKAYVDGQWLSHFSERLARYRAESEDAI